MQQKDTILTVGVVEPGLVNAVKLQSQALGRELKGLVLVHTGFVDQPGRPVDTSGLFEEIVCDFNNPNELQNVLKPYADRILAATCRYEETVQHLSQVIPFIPYVPTPTETSLYWATEKPLMRDRLSNYNPSLTPHYTYLEEHNLHLLEDMLHGFNWPVVVKPSGLAKSLLVTPCDNLDELKTCLTRTFDTIHQVYERENYPGEPGVLIEEMMYGDMFSTDAYVTQDGQIFCLPLVQVITAHSIGKPGGFYGYEIIAPPPISDEESEAAFTACRSAIKALNLRSVTTHIELYRTEEGWKIIELAARIGGYREMLYREVYGIEHFYNDLSVRMGKLPEMPTVAKKHAIKVGIYADEEGVIESIQGLETARELPSIVYLDAYAKPGDTALFANHGGNLVVDGILSNTDPEQLRADADKVRELINISIKK